MNQKDLISILTAINSLSQLADQVRDLQVKLTTLVELELASRASEQVVDTIAGAAAPAPAPAPAAPAPAPAAPAPAPAAPAPAAPAAPQLSLVELNEKLADEVEKRFGGDPTDVFALMKAPPFNSDNLKSVKPSQYYELLNAVKALPSKV